MHKRKYAYEKVLDDLEGRVKVGIERYGVVLAPNNGRNSLLDAYEEVLDAVIYMSNALMEAESKEEDNTTLDAYQTRTLNTAVYPGAGMRNEKAINYTVLGLASEAGEVAGKLSKAIRGDKGTVAKDEMLGELGDVLWFVARVADEFDIKLSEVADANIRKLEDRKKRNVIKGDGDTR